MTAGPTTAALNQFVSWTGGCIFIGRHNPVVPMHAHYAIQIAFGREHGIAFRTSDSGEWTRYGGAIIPSRQPHSMDPTRMSANAVMFVEPETREGRLLDELFLADGIAEMPESALADVQALFDAWESGDRASLTESCITLIRSLTGSVKPASPSDERILKAVAFINANLDHKLSLEDVAAHVFLSPSRFRHLFIEETGMALRPYMLWRRFLKVWELIAEGTIEARVTAILNGDVPDVSKWPGLATTTPPASVTLETKTFPVPMPVIDGAIGVFKGLPLGLTNVGGIDLLGSVAYIPSVDQTEIKITPDANTKFGYGARIGLLQESLLIPGLSATWMKRDLPTTSITGTGNFTGTSMSFTMSDAAIKTTSWRLVASKSFILFGLAAGYGQDSYDETATFSGSATVGTTTTTFSPFTLSSKMTRSNVFANASINLLLLKLVGEIGQVSGGDASPTFNTFSGGKADDSRAYGSVGLRFSW